MKILVAGWDSGGGVEAVQTVVRRAAARGHQVRVLGTEGLRSRFSSAGADFRAYRYTPDNDCRSAATDLVREWEARTPQRAAEALGRLPVRGLVTTGPAVNPAAIRAPANVSVRRWVRHADVLPSCSAVLTHGGHGTVMKALAAGVPLVVAPLGRDQPDNAARVVHAGAGLWVSKKAGVPALRDAIARTLDEPRYRAAARRMAATLAAERNEALVVDELELAALEGTAMSHSLPRDPSWR